MRISEVVQTTSPKTASVKYKKKWLELRHGKTVDDSCVWIFTDGSSTGWHAAVIVDPRCNSVTRIADFADPKSNNVGPELWALALALEKLVDSRPIVVVHDYIGVGAWVVGAWEMKSPNVVEAVHRVKRLLEARSPDTVTFIHHPGHQTDSSDFTRWNNEADELCNNKSKVCRVEVWCGQ